ncbi:MAG: hypothetical protein ABSB24_15160 [Gaiellaceae bacterium]|jgi:ABC-type uncharacterized transport system permease subunit
MDAAWAQLLAVRLTFLSGVLAGVAGVALLVLDLDEPFAAPATAGGLALVAWVIFHPRRADA